MVKTVDDYIDIIQKKFYSRFTAKTIRDILYHGLMNFFLYSKIGDFWIKSDGGSSLCGHRFFDNRIRARYIYTKYRKKIRREYLKNLAPFDGKYYFGVDESKHKNMKYYYKIQFPRWCWFSRLPEEAYMFSKSTRFYILYCPVDIGLAFRRK